LEYLDHGILVILVHGYQRYRRNYCLHIQEKKC